MASARSGAQRFFALCAALPVLLACPARAAKWDIVPTLSVGEIYTNNLSLSPDTSKRSAWVTQVVPGISISATGAASRFNVSYTPQLLYYAKGEADNKVYHQLRAFGTAELAQQLLFVDAGADVGPQFGSLLAPLSLSSFNTTGNVASVGRYHVSPFLRREFGAAVQAEARFTYSVVRSDAPPSIFPDSVADRINLRLNSGPAHRLLVWNIDYKKENIDYETQQRIDSEVTNANARHLITPTVGLVARVGYDYYKGTFSPVSEGPAWGAGFDWTPTSRTRLAVGAGQRFYGDEYLLDFAHRTRITTWSAGYHQEITTTRQQFLVPVTTSTAGYLDTLYLARFPDPVARQQAVEEFIARTGLPPSLSAPVNFFSSQLFLEKRWQASTGILGVRNTLIVNVFGLTREGLAGSLVLPTAPNTSIQTGTGLLWNLRVTARNDWNLRAGYTRNEFPSIGRIDNLAYVVMGPTWQLQPRLSGSLNYRRQQRDSNFIGSDYAENAVFATLQMRF